MSQFWKVDRIRVKSSFRFIVFCRIKNIYKEINFQSVVTAAHCAPIGWKLGYIVVSSTNSYLCTTLSILIVIMREQK